MCQGTLTPVVPRNANPVVPGNANPVVPRNANPVVPRNANPVVSRNANPVVSRNANPWTQGSRPNHGQSCVQNEDHHLINHGQGVAPLPFGI